MPKLPTTNRGQFWLAALAFVAFAAVVSMTAVRIVRGYQTPGPFDRSHQGFCDFHNGVYFPSLAFREGVSPYGPNYARDYPVERTIPFFSPIIVAAHVPFTWLPLHVAEASYFAWMLALVLGIAACTAKWLSPTWRWDLFAIAALAIVTMRGGQQTLFTGYFTLELILASLVAVHYGKSRPWLSALALIVVSAKPNYVLPIALLMLCRGNLKAVLWGGILSAALAAFAFAWIMPEGGIPELVEQIQSTQQSHVEDATERPINSWVRVDTLALFAKWTDADPPAMVILITMLIFLMPAGFLLWKLRLADANTDAGSIGEATDLGGGLVLLTSLVAVYHHVYDALVLLPVALALCQSSVHNAFPISGPVRLLLCVCWLIPGFNYASSEKFLNTFAIEGFLHRLLTSVNAAALLVSWLVLLYLIARQISHRSKNSSDKHEIAT